MRCLLWGFEENWPCYEVTVLFFVGGFWLIHATGGKWYMFTLEIALIMLPYRHSDFSTPEATQWFTHHWGVPREPCLWPGTRFTNILWAHNPKLVKIHVAVTWKQLMISGHNFAHAMTAELSWHVQICDLIGLLEWKLNMLTQKEISQDLDQELINPRWIGPCIPQCVCAYHAVLVVIVVCGPAAVLPSIPVTPTIPSYGYLTQVNDWSGTLDST